MFASIDTYLPPSSVSTLIVEFPVCDVCLASGNNCRFVEGIQKMHRIMAMSHGKGYSFAPYSTDPEPKPGKIDSEVATNVNEHAIHLINGLDDDEPEFKDLTGTYAQGGTGKLLLSSRDAIAYDPSSR